MKRNKIEDLLDKYFKAETTLEEEQQLQRYFTSDDIEAKLLPYKSYFDYIQTEKITQLSADFDARLMEKLEGTPKKIKVRRLWPVLSRIAAVIVLAVAIYFLIPQPITPEPTAIDWSKYEVQSVEEAVSLTRESLLKTSLELNNASAHSRKNVQKVKALSKASSISAREMRKMQELTRIFK